MNRKELNDAYGNVLIHLSKCIRRNTEAAEGNKHNALVLIAESRVNAFEQALAIVRENMDPIMREE